MLLHCLKTVVLAIIILPFSQVHAQLGPETTSNLRPTDLERVKVGGLAPDFTLEDTDGSQVSLANYRSKKKVILVFYRGHW